MSDFEQADGTFVVDEGSSLDVGLGLIGDFHDKLGVAVDHVLENGFVDPGVQGVSVDQYRRECTYTAPKLSELDTNKYSLPSAKSWSKTPLCNRALYKSP